VITSFEVDRSVNGWVEERSSINDRGAASRIFERLATLHAVAASKIVCDAVGCEYITTPSSRKLTFQALSCLALPPASLQRFAW
jgi:hypothetical protein